MEWNEDIIARLRDLWTEGHSTAEIGRRLGVSKNAIVGKAHRLDLAARPSPIRREGVAPETTRRSSPRRVEGPTLPPLASAELSPIPDVMPVAHPVMLEPLAAAPATVEAEPEVVVIDIAPPAPVVVAAVVVPPAPPRASAPPPPRMQVVAPRPYGRVVTCCWPIGEPGTKSFHFCDDPSDPGKPYCGEHAKLAYVKVRDRREDAA